VIKQALNRLSKRLESLTSDNTYPASFKALSKEDKQETVRTFRKRAEATRHTATMYKEDMVPAEYEATLQVGRGYEAAADLIEQILGEKVLFIPTPAPEMQKAYEHVAGPPPATMGEDMELPAEAFEPFEQRPAPVLENYRVQPPPTPEQQHGKLYMDRVAPAPPQPPLPQINPLYREGGQPFYERNSNGEIALPAAAFAPPIMPDPAMEHVELKSLLERRVRELQAISASRDGEQRTEIASWGAFVNLFLGSPSATLAEGRNLLADSDVILESFGREQAGPTKAVAELLVEDLPRNGKPVEDITDKVIRRAATLETAYQACGGAVEPDLAEEIQVTLSIVQRWHTHGQQAEVPASKLMGDMRKLIGQLQSMTRRSTDEVALERKVSEAEETLLLRGDSMDPGDRAAHELFIAQGHASLAAR